MRARLKAGFSFVADNGADPTPFAESSGSFFLLLGVDAVKRVGYIFTNIGASFENNACSEGFGRKLLNSVSFFALTTKSGFSRRPFSTSATLKTLS